MSSLKNLGFDIDAPIQWINAEKTSAQITNNGMPYGIDINATPQQWEALMADLDDNLIVIQEMATKPELPLVALAAVARVERNKLLTESDWTQMPDAPILTSKRNEWSAYRKALRDITSQSEFPLSVVWPKMP